MENFKLVIDADGIALVTFDVPGRSMNTLTDRVITEMPGLVEDIQADERIKGVLLRSGKGSGFCAGADLGDLAKQAGSRVPLPKLSQTFRTFELMGKPIAVALEGLALGGGLELALACHYRVAADHPKIVFGLPEANVGLLPGAGGTQRLPRLIGVQQALPMLLQGSPVDPQKARELGFIDEVVPAGEVVATARKWLIAHGDAVPRWDKKGYRVPGGLPYSPAGMQTFVMANALLRKSTYGNYPAQENILRSVFEGIALPLDAGLRIESRYFKNTFATPQAAGMIRTLFLSKQALAKGGEWAGKGKPPTKATVIGAGMMGAGIAYAQAARRIETVLIDVDEAGAERGKDYSRGIVAQAIKRGKLSAADGEALLARITPSASFDAIEGSQLVVEAVFEDVALKNDVIRRVGQRIGDGAVLGSNTSTLPITALSESSSRPADFVGIHFFSPVDRMELVEIIRGEKTSEETIARAVAYAVALGKTPIVVNDRRGFFTSRCFGTYIYEAFEMLIEGVPLALIENAGRMTGMPRGPLELADDVALDLVARIFDQTGLALGDEYQVRPYEQLLRTLVAEGRTGRKASAGFYDYPAIGPKRLWQAIGDYLPPAPAAADTDVERLKQRLLHRQAIEAARCFDEGVITDPRMADVGAVLGWGFAPWTGGPLSYIDGIGAACFVAEADALVARCGPRFAPPDGLRRLARDNAGYYHTAARAAA